MEYLALGAAALCILASLAAIASAVASLALLLRRAEDDAEEEKPAAPILPLWPEGGTREDGAGSETPEVRLLRLRREAEARERFEDGMRSILGYGNPISGGRA